MPTYEYYCKECDSVFTEVRKMSDKTKYGKCPIDSKPLVRKYDVAVSFTGEGFYSTDKKKPSGE